MDQEQGIKNEQISLRKQQKNFTTNTKQDTNERVLTPQELLCIDKLYPGGVKLTETESIINKQQIKLVDFRNAGHNFTEDEIFAHQPNILHNIRRGITVIVEGIKQPQILRRGLKKFFDINLAILNDEKQQIGRVDQVLYNYTLKEVLQCLEVKKHPISIYVLEKANGENAQISYYQPLNRWVVCSKNVAILFSEDDNLDLLQEQRYKFVKIFAQVWKKYLLTLDQNFIKQVLQDHTLIGEYCGDQAFQHIVNYQEIQLRFYALVNHHSMDTCIDPIKTQEFLNQSKLQSVNITYQTQVNDVQNFKNAINFIYQQISVAKLEEQGEGAVIYMVDNTERRCISLGKIKTLRYRLLRKIREKTKNYVSQFDLNKPQINQEEIIASMCFKYSNEVESLCAGIQVNFDLQEYINLLNKSLHCVYKFLVESNKQNFEQNQKHCFTILTSRYVEYQDQISVGNMNALSQIKQI